MNWALHFPQAELQPYVAPARSLGARLRPPAADRGLVSPGPVDIAGRQRDGPHPSSADRPAAGHRSPTAGRRRSEPEPCAAEVVPARPGLSGSRQRETGVGTEAGPCLAGRERGMLTNWTLNRRGLISLGFCFSVLLGSNFPSLRCARIKVKYFRDP